MMYRILILLLVGSCLCFSVSGQKKHLNKINQLNINGKKDGLWVDSTKYWIHETYYKNGVLSGVYKERNMKGQLSTFGEYKEGKRSGKWFFFENSGHLVMVFQDFANNTFSVINEGNNKRYIPDYKCYTISYHPNGNIESEGLLLWSEGDAPESDMSIEYGEWKYYDSEGKLIKTKVFKY